MMSEEGKEFCEKFKAGVEELGLNHSQMAEHFSADKWTAQRWLRGETAPMKGYQELVLNKINELREMKAQEVALANQIEKDYNGEEN